MNTNYEDLKKSLDKVNFIPWVGENYADARLFGKRIMVLGEGHICDSCGNGNWRNCSNYVKSDPSCYMLTKNSVEAYITGNGQGGWMNTYLKFERSLVNRYTTFEERRKIWNNILFYNYLQYALDECRKAGNGEAYEVASEAFFQVMEHFKPELLIVWGKRLWNMMGSEKWTRTDSCVIDGYPNECGFYTLSDGQKVKTFVVYHPSSGYSWDYWFSVIEAMSK